MLTCHEGWEDDAGCELLVSGQDVVQSSSTSADALHSEGSIVNFEGNYLVLSFKIFYLLSDSVSDSPALPSQQLLPQGCLRGCFSTRAFMV